MPGRVFTQTAARRRSLRAWDWHPPDLGRPSDPSGLRAPNLGGVPPTSRQRRADAHPDASSRTPLGERGSMSPSTGSRQARGRHLSASGAMNEEGQKTKKTTHETALPPGPTRSIPARRSSQNFWRRPRRRHHRGSRGPSGVPLRQQRGEGRRGGRVWRLLGFGKTGWKTRNITLTKQNSNIYFS